ncbi:MAG: tRNA-binding protein [Pseudomonadota bacterium]
MDEISWEEFAKIQLRVGTVVDAQGFPEARKPAFKLWIDFGEEIGTKKSSAQITDLYSCDALIGKQVVAVVNFPPKQIGPITSGCLITGFYQEDGSVVLACPDKTVPNGARLV